ncbi:MAG: hypothetical protein J5I93_22325 [Pirellulaceae bacterium]|nr:hypothetical protein [Pirellulaceae bacterium]
MKCGLRNWGVVAAVLLALALAVPQPSAAGQGDEVNDATPLEARVQQLETRVQQLENLAAVLEQLTKAITDLQRTLAEQKAFKPEVAAAGSDDAATQTGGSSESATDSAAAATTAGRILVHNPDTVTKIIKLNDRQFRVAPGSTRLNMNPYGPVELMQFENLPEDRNDWRWNEQDGVYELIVNLR